MVGLGRRRGRAGLLGVQQPGHPAEASRDLHLPSGWPWAEGFLTALFRLRALPLRT
jgi:hypothetical protein